MVSAKWEGIQDKRTHIRDQTIDHRHGDVEHSQNPNLRVHQTLKELIHTPGIRLGCFLLALDTLVDSNPFLRTQERSFQGRVWQSEEQKHPPENRETSEKNEKPLG